MNDFHKTFNGIYEYITANSLSFHPKESIEHFNLEFKMPYEKVMNMVNEYHQACFINHKIGLTVGEKNQESSFLYDEFLRLGPIIYKEKPEYIISIEIKINKKSAYELIENEFLFLDLESFTTHFNFNNNVFENINNKKKLLIFLPIQESIENKYLHLIPLSTEQHERDIDQIIIDQTEHERLTKIRDESCKFPSCYAVPEMFLMESTTNNDFFESWFERNLFGVSLCHIANKVIDGNIMMIKGSKNIEISLSQIFNASNARSIYNIYKFSYEEKHYSDKIEISRNVITIYLNPSEDVEKLNELAPTIEKTIRSHFTAYIQDSIKKFFNDRKDIIKETHKFASDIKSEADKLMTYINTSLIGIVTAIFAGSLGLSKGERWFLLLAFGLHGIAFLLTYLFNKSFVMKRITNIEKLYDDYIEKFVVLAKNELDEIKGMYIVPSIKNVNDYLKTYRLVTMILILLMMILVVVGISLPNHVFSADAKATVTSNVYTNIK